MKVVSALSRCSAMSNQRFQAVNFMRCSVEHLTLTVHYYIQVAVESALVAVEPFDIFQLGVFVVNLLSLFLTLS